MNNQKKLDTKNKHGAAKNKKFWVVFIFLIFILGFTVRIYDLTDAPLDFHPTRQLHSAIIARGMYYQGLETIPEWQKERAFNQWQSEGLIEPQVMEALTAITYSLIGSEQLWVARLWSIFFWMVGSIFVFLLSRKMVGIQGAAAAIVFFLFWPYAAIASRSFQPESLMIMMITTGIWAAVLWVEKQSWWWAVLTGLLCGLAIYVKSVAVFFVAPAMAGLILTNFSFPKAIKNRQIWLIFALAVLPYTLYHLFGVFVLGLLGQQFNLRFFPAMWFNPVFYIKWVGELNRVVSLEIFLAAIFGVLIFPKKKYSGVLLGLVIGYFLYGFTFSYHISTHDYYHLPLFILVSLGLSHLVEGLLKGVHSEDRKASGKLLIALMVIFMLIKAWDVRASLKRVDYRNEVGFWQNLGKEIGYGKKVTGLLADYGYRLSYWGWINVSPWMQTADINLRELAGEEVDYQNALKEITASNDYFIVTSLDEFAQQHQLEFYLRSNFKVYKESEVVIIFDLKQMMENNQS